MTNSKFSSQNIGEIDFQMSKVTVTIKSVFCDLIEKNHSECINDLFSVALGGDIVVSNPSYCFGMWLNLLLQSIS